MEQLLKELKNVEDFLGVEIYPKNVNNLRNNHNETSINRFRGRIPVSLFI